MPKMHHFATRYGYFVLIWVFLLWFCLKSYFFHRLQIFLFENQPLPHKFMDPLEWFDLCSLRFLPFLWISSLDNFAFFLLLFWIITVCKVNPRSYELPANPIKLILSDLKLNFSGFIVLLGSGYSVPFFFFFNGIWFFFCSNFLLFSPLKLRN